MNEIIKRIALNFVLGRSQDITDIQMLQRSMPKASGLELFQFHLLLKEFLHFNRELLIQELKLNELQVLKNGKYRTIKFYV